MKKLIKLKCSKSIISFFYLTVLLMIFNNKYLSIYAIMFINNASFQQYKFKSFSALWLNGSKKYAFEKLVYFYLKIEKCI